VWVRRARVSACYSTAAGYASGSRHDLDQAAAVAELCAVTTDPDELAEAAAMFAAPHGERPWYADTAHAVLIAAGADPTAVDRHAAARRRRRPGGVQFGQPQH
jgi:hypothetical protein